MKHRSAPQHLAVETEKAILADRVEHARPRADWGWRWHLWADSRQCLASVRADLSAAAGESIGSRALRPGCNDPKEPHETETDKAAYVRA